MINWCMNYTAQIRFWWLAIWTWGYLSHFYPDRTKKVIAFVSRIFNKNRLNYLQVDKEILILTKFHLCLLVNSLACFYWKFCYNFNYNFLGSVFWSNGLVVKALDSQSRGPMFKTTDWLQGRLSLSSFGGW